MNLQFHLFVLGNILATSPPHAGLEKVCHSSMLKYMIKQWSGCVANGALG